MIMSQWATDLSGIALILSIVVLSTYCMYKLLKDA